MSYKSSVSLIPGGVIQFLDLDLELDRRSIGPLRTEFWEPIASQGGGRPKKYFKCLMRDTDEDHYLDLQTGDVPISFSTGEADKGIQPEYSLTVDKVLETFSGHWIPLPFFRSVSATGSLDRRFRRGPSDWARARLDEITVGQAHASGTHRLTIAFDTHIDEAFDAHSEIPQDGYPALSILDVRDGAEFQLVSEFGSYSWFLGLDWVSAWLQEIFVAALQRKRPRRQLREVDFDYQYEHLARYVSFIEILSSAGKVPNVRVTDPRRHVPVDVDLVLDIGNSRTLGMLIERRPGEAVTLDSGGVLELRDLSRPAQRYKGTFSSHICFSNAGFGDPTGRRSSDSGRERMAFGWPSVVRVGEEAMRLARESKRYDGQTSMSSPKRYLWDVDARVQQWRFAPEEADPYQTESPVNRGEFVAFVNNEGTPLHAFDSPRTTPAFARGQRDLPVIEPRFSRSSMMMFLLSEIISQALVQICSPEYRQKKLNPDLARRLRSIILIVPSALSVSERRLYEQWVNWACDLVRKSLGWYDQAWPEDDYRRKPQCKMHLDEATATQLVFVYNEIERRFSGNAARYFEIFGSRRDDAGDGFTLRVATIDIGGGTTDMAISTYGTEAAGATTILIPRQDFREGFNFAGDDLVRAAIEEHLLPEFLLFLRGHDPSANRELLKRRFGRDTVDSSERDKNLRAQFGQKVFVPLILHFFRQLENRSSHEFEALPPCQVGLKEVLDEVQSHDPDLQEFLLGFLSDKTLAVDLLDWCPTVNLASLATTITSVMSPYLIDLSEVVQRYRCDFLVVSGRPSCLSPIRSIFTKYSPVDLSRLVFMGDYEVEGWYPFLTRVDGRISDPKTTGVVGALLCTVSEGNLNNFHIRTSSLRPASTIRYVGILGSDKQLKDSMLLFDGSDVSLSRDDELSADIQFQTQTFIGFRQMSVERWKATPFYQLTFSDQKAAAKATSDGPYTVTLCYKRAFDDWEGTTEVNWENEGQLLISEIQDRAGAAIPRSDLRIRLKTLWDESHWLDSGQFEIS